MLYGIIHLEKKNIKTYIEQEEFINEFLLNMNVEN